MIIRKANLSDSSALIKLTASSPMEGKVSLRIDRQPDFFNLLNERGNYIVIVAEDSHKQIIGCFSATRQHILFNEQIHPLYYLGDLKVAAAYRQSSIAFRLVKAMQREIVHKDVSLFVCTATEGNQPVFPFFEGRAGFPVFRQTSVFNVFQLLPKRCAPDDMHAYPVNKPELAAFYEAYFQRYSFHPPITNLDACTNFCFIENGSIAAAISLYDPVALKQNVVIDYPLSVSITLAILRTLKIFLPLPSIPVKGSTLKLLYIKYAAFKSGYEKQWLNLLKYSRQLAFEKGYHFLTMAVDEKDVNVIRIMKPLSQFNFRSHQLIANLGHNEEMNERIRTYIAYEDYSLV